jgi:hypothetical protein
MPPKSREPQFPLKTQRTLVSDEQIALARENVAKYDTAKAVADKIIRRADEWLAWDVDALRNLVPTADVPRAFNVGTAGCPQCGKQIYEKGGTYPWIIDPKQPFKVTCPVDGSTYPSNDYAAFYASGLEDRSLLTGDYADDGWGWVGPTGEKYWFVAYANHWTWENHIIPATLYLAQAYLLTGDAAYAHKSAVLLDRIAEVYPNMDHHSQSRYGQLQAANGARYEGKIVNHIWETGVLTTLSESYDYVWETIDDETVPGKTGEQMRANIEANLLEEGIDSYFSGKIRGNFGMHQKALVYAAIARQYGKQDEWLDGILNNASDSYAMTGLNYALYNLVYRDGAPYETSPGYNFSWVVNLTTVAKALERAGYDVYAIPKMRRLYDAVLDIVNTDAFTPSIGDSGSVYGGLVGQDAFVYQNAFRAYGDPRYRAHLQSFGAVGGVGFSRFDTLFDPPIEAEETPEAPVVSRLLDGYGMAILNNPANTISLSLYYGYAGGHGHSDRLHFELFANGQVMMPDTGYPDFMNAYVPGIYTWTKNTIAHNTVTVDASHQSGNHNGTVRLFVDQGFARALDIDASETYAQTSEYRRRLMMTDVDDSHSYIVDCFTAVGGAQHDYSLHGPPGTFTAVAGEWSDPALGTLAGEDVPVGYIYDEPALAPEDYTGSYAGYHGSGFQHLFNVQRASGGPVIGEWTHEKDESAKLRVQVVAPDAEAILADAHVSPVKQHQLLKYVIARRQGDSLQSRFVSVIEPFSESPVVASVEPIGSVEGGGVALSIRTQGAGDPRDVVIINTGGQTICIDEPSIDTDAAFALVRFAGLQVTHRWFAGGTYLTVGDERLAQHPPLAGEVTFVNPETSQIRLRTEATDLDLDALVGRVVHFENDIRRTAHAISRVERSDDGLTITVRDDLRVGRVRVAQVNPEGFTTATGLAFAPVYDGAYASDPEFASFVPLRQVSGGTLEFMTPIAEDSPFTTGDDAWIINVGPGDHFEILRATAVVTAR